MTTLLDHPSGVVLGLARRLEVVSMPSSGDHHASSPRLCGACSDASTLCASPCKLCSRRLPCAATSDLQLTGPCRWRSSGYAPPPGFAIACMPGLRWAGRSHEPSGWVRPKSGHSFDQHFGLRVRPSVTNLWGRLRPTCGRVRPILGRCLARLGWSRPEMGRLRPTWVAVGHARVC